MCIFNEVWRLSRGAHINKETAKAIIAWEKKTNNYRP